MKNPVTIVGAGLGGLILARVLHLNGFPVTVYEGELSPESRTQGGQLDIHLHNGQIALDIAKLTKEFRSIIHEGAEATRILGKDANVLFEEADGGSRNRPEVLRGDLRRILRESLPDGAIQWGKKLTSATSLGDGRHTLLFADGTSVVTSVLVGADGAFSKVRALVSTAIPTYTGTAFIDTFLHDVETRHSETVRQVGAGAMYAFAPGQGIVAHREAGNIIHTYIQLVRPLEWVQSIDFNNPEGAKARIAAEFAGWADPLTTLITNSDTAPVLRLIYSLPDNHRWDRVPGVTLIGDAAHLMPPSGEGANLAMLDGAELGEAIAKHPDDIEAGFAAYEATMFSRSASEAIDAHQLIDLCLGSTAPHGLVQFFKSANG